MTETWKAFFEGYRRRAAETDADLFVEVGRTVNGEPISPAQFRQELERVSLKLSLEPADVLFEYCCGNGLVSFELAARVRHVIAVDFTEHLIANARRRRHRDNIDYHLGDALEPLGRFIGAHRPTKYLMSFALAHFGPADLSSMLGNVAAVSPPGGFRFLMTGIPDVDRKWNFYDTPERRARHVANQERGDPINDGIGRWWSAGELREVARSHGLEAQIEPEPHELSNYRMDALLA